MVYICCMQKIPLFMKTAFFLVNHLKEEDIYVIIKNLIPNKAHEWDDISIRMNKLCGLSIIYWVSFEVVVSVRSCHQGCSIKNMFLEISQNSQENTFARACAVILKSIFLKKIFSWGKGTKTPRFCSPFFWLKRHIYIYIYIYIYWLQFLTSLLNWC